MRSKWYSKRKREENGAAVLTDWRSRLRFSFFSSFLSGSFFLENLIHYSILLPAFAITLYFTPIQSPLPLLLRSFFLPLHDHRLLLIICLWSLCLLIIYAVQTEIYNRSGRRTDKGRGRSSTAKQLVHFMTFSSSSTFTPFTLGMQGSVDDQLDHTLEIDIKSFIFIQD